MRRAHSGETSTALVAEDLLPDEASSKQLRVGRRTLDRWKAHPAFAARIRENVEAWCKASLEQSIADYRYRVGQLVERHRQMRRLIQARAGEHAGVPGGATGLIVKEVRIAKDGTRIEWFAFDAPLMRELRAHEEQVAKELGQWTEKRNIDDVVHVKAADRCQTE